VEWSGGVDERREEERTCMTKAIIIMNMMNLLGIYIE
jgi:hypothetical protein